MRALAVRGDALVPITEGETPDAVVLEVSGSVHYAAVDGLLQEADRMVPPSARLVIVDLSHAHELRFTGLQGLEWWTKRLEARGVRVRLAGVTPEVRDLLEGAHSHLQYTMADAMPGRSALESYREGRR